MNENRISRDIEFFGYKKLLIKALGFVALLFTLGIALGLLFKSVESTSYKLAAEALVSGFLLGYATSILTIQSRKLLIGAFLFSTIAASLLLFIMRTLYGYSAQIPLLTAFAPLFLSIGYLGGQINWKKALYLLRS